jgi:hypothetical protein
VGEVVPVPGSGPLVVVVVEDVEEEEVSEEVGVPEPVVSTGAVVVVVVVVVVEEDGSVVVVLGSGGSVVEVVSVPAPGSAAEVSARAGAAGTQTTAMNTVVMARPRRMRLDNTGISSPGVRGYPPEYDGLDWQRCGAHRAATAVRHQRECSRTMTEIGAARGRPVNPRGAGRTGRVMTGITDRVGSIGAMIRVQPLQEPPSRGPHTGAAGAAGARPGRA